MRLFLSLFALGCARERDRAPATLDEQVHRLFADFEDEAALSEALVPLQDWLEAHAEDDESWEGLRLTNLQATEVRGVDAAPGTRLADHVGLATAALSAYPLRDHAALLVEPDQTWTDPRSFLRYDRQILEGDVDAFTDGRGLVRTDNTIEKAGPFGISIPYTLRKDYRWVGEQAILGRAWVTEAGCSENGKNCVYQSWGVDAFLERPGGSYRLYAVWLEVVTQADSLLSEDAKIGLIATGNQDILEATEEELAGR